VLGQPAGAAALRTSVAYTTQAPSVYGDLTVAQNLTYFTALAGAPRRAIDPVLAEVGLTPYVSQLTRTLSGGQLHRVSLAYALVGEPQLLVLDEPTVGLDPLLREEIWASLRARAERGTTILVSSHVMEEARKCDELILLREGEVLFAGTPEELQTRTATADLDEAFLRLVRAPEQADSA
jgi:ABC-2 type transport system ATP-binding protein